MREFINTYFRVTSLIFLILIIIYAIIHLDNEEYLRALISSIAINIPIIVAGSIPIALLYFYIKKKSNS